MATNTDKCERCLKEFPIAQLRYAMYKKAIGGTGWKRLCVECRKLEKAEK